MRIRRLVRGEAGAELLEFALVSMCLFMFVFGSMEFGREIWLSNIIASAAKDGVRYAAVRGSNAASPASAGDVQTYVQGRCYGMTVTVTTTWPDAGNNDPGDRVAVDVQGTFHTIVPLLPQFTRTLDSQAQMIIAR